jgi:signal transduction histidine kinase
MADLRASEASATAPVRWAMSDRRARPAELGDVPRLPRPLGLRARAAIAFGLIALFSSVALAVTTYFVVRSYLVEQRTDAATRQAFANARLARNGLRADDVDVTALLATIRGESGSDVVANLDGAWFSSSVATGEDSIPLSLRQVVADGAAGNQLVRGPDEELQVVVGTPIAAIDAGYFEVFHLDELERTLDLLRWVLVGAGAVTVLAATVLGRFAAGRVVEPLGPVARTASRIAQGDLSARLPDRRDPDLEELTVAFNSMAAALEERVEREQQFASDVSHELRTPLAAFRAALEVIERRRDEMPAGVDDALDILAGRSESFEALVLDLLEMSRYDADAIAPMMEELEVETFARQTLEAYDAPSARLTIHPGVPDTIRADRRRLAQALGNVIVNAAKYGGGLVELSIDATDDVVRFVLDDAGSGVDPTERTAIFERFARGREGRVAGGASGTGLGLSLALAQVQLHGGEIGVDDRPGGGARFVISIPRGTS